MKGNSKTMLKTDNVLMHLKYILILGSCICNIKYTVRKSKSLYLLNYLKDLVVPV